MRLIRRQIEAASEMGIDWRSVIDCLRPVIPQMWQSLPRDEQKRFLRHARAYWDVHRHRIAPEIADLLSDMMTERQVLVHRGRISGHLEDGRIAWITYRQRGAGTKTLRVHRAINCTGSETDCRRIDDFLIASLLVQGLARPDPLFLGLESDEQGALVDYTGVPANSLFTIGPTRKGCLWETYCSA
jgi:uncharacterized NAD(P)/FAD-binding protein YdhS